MQLHSLGAQLWIIGVDPLSIPKFQKLYPSSTCFPVPLCNWIQNLCTDATCGWWIWRWFYMSGSLSSGFRNNIICTTLVSTQILQIVSTIVLVWYCICLVWIADECNIFVWNVVLVDPMNWQNFPNFQMFHRTCVAKGYLKSKLVLDGINPHNVKCSKQIDMYVGCFIYM